MKTKSIKTKSLMTKSLKTAFLRIKSLRTHIMKIKFLKNHILKTESWESRFLKKYFLKTKVLWCVLECRLSEEKDNPEVHRYSIPERCRGSNDGRGQI